MNQKAFEIRTRQWKKIIAAANRSGMHKKDWCKKHNVSERQFYYWQAKLRTKAISDMESTLPLDQIGEKSVSSEGSGFLELTAPEPQEDSYIVETESTETMAQGSHGREMPMPEMILQYGMFQILITNRIREETLRTVLKVVKDA